MWLFQAGRRHALAGPLFFGNLYVRVRLVGCSSAFLYSSCNAEREFGKPRTTPHRGFPFMQVQAPNVLRTLGGRLFCAAQRLPCIALGPLN